MSAPATGSDFMAYLGRHGPARLGVIVVLLGFDLVWVAANYLVYPGYLDHGETAVAAMTWHVVNGLAAYPPIDAADQITNLYGPVTYLFNGLFYLVAGAGLASSKASGLVAMLAIPVVVGLTHRRDGPVTALTATILAGGFIVIALPFSIWNRPDPMIALLVAIAVLAMRTAPAEGPAWRPSLIIGLAAGLAAGLKIHAGLYFLPVALTHCRGRGFAASLAFIGVAAAAVVLLPFASSSFSLFDYLAWFPLMAGKPSDPATLAKVLRYAAYYLAPLLFLVFAWRWSERALDHGEFLYAGTFVACLLLVLVPAAKPGAGWHYLFPFLAVSVDLTVRFWRRVPNNRVTQFTVAVLAAVMLLASVPVQTRFARALHWQQAERIAAEVVAIISAYPGKKLQMGVGDTLRNYHLAYYKPLLVFAGHPYMLDAGVRMETSKLGIPLPAAFIRRIETCYIDAWLLPKGERPFELIGYYGNPNFGPAFLDAFRAAYTKEKSFEFFDVWACKR